MQWSIANSFFQAAIPVSEITQENTDACICKMNETIYEYFKGTYGTVNKGNSNEDQQFKTKYEDFSKNKLKKALRFLKNTGRDSDEIKYVAKLLRPKLQPNPLDNNGPVYSVDHNRLCSGYYQ